MTNKQPNPYWKDAVKIWFDFYRIKTGQEYVFDGTQGKHLKQLLSKVKSKLTQKGLPVTDESVLQNLKSFLEHITDKWILEHLEISVINSKFNSTYAGAVNSNPFGTANRISELVQQKFGTGSISQQG